MAVELGSGYVSVVASAKGIKKSLTDEIERPAQASGEKAGKDASDGFGSNFDITDAVKFAAIAAGAVLVKALYDGIEQEGATDRLAGSLGLDPAEAERLGGITGDIYADAYGDSFEGVGDVLRTAFLVDPTATDEALEALTVKAINLETAFGGAADEYLVFAQQLNEQGITDSVDESLDYITTAFQQVPASMQGPLQDALTEYLPFLDSLGFSTEEAFAFITSSASKGEFALDKAGDAIKEFGIRATDGSKATSQAYDAIGLDAETMAARLLAGGDEADGAFDDIVEGLLSIEDPVEQANASIALFGTPLEDLGVNEIPSFLESLSGVPEGFEDVGGAAGDLDEVLNSNLGTSLEELKRGALQGLVDIITLYVIPAITSLMGWISEIVAGFQGNTEDGEENFLTRAGETIAALVTYIEENWPPVKETLLEVFEEVKTWVDENWPEIEATITQVLTIIEDAIVLFVELVGAVWEEHGETIVRAIEIAWDLISGIVTAALDIIQGIITTVTGLITGDWDKVWEGIKQIVDGAWEGIKTLVGAALDALYEVIEGQLDTAKTFIEDTWDSIVDNVSGLGERISTAASGIFDGIKEAFRSAINWVIRKWNSLSFDVPSIPNPFGDGSFGGGSFGPPQIDEFHTGGLVPGRAGQEVPAILLAGERVLSPAQTREYDSGRGRPSGPLIENYYGDSRNLWEQLAEVDAMYAVAA